MKNTCTKRLLKRSRWAKQIIQKHVHTLWVKLLMLYYNLVPLSAFWKKMTNINHLSHEKTLSSALIKLTGLKSRIHSLSGLLLSLFSVDTEHQTHILRIRTTLTKSFGSSPTPYNLKHNSPEAWGPLIRGEGLIKLTKCHILSPPLNRTVPLTWKKVRSIETMSRSGPDPSRHLPPHSSEVVTRFVLWTKGAKEKQNVSVWI